MACFLGRRVTADSAALIKIGKATVLAARLRGTATCRDEKSNLLRQSFVIHIAVGVRRRRLPRPFVSSLVHATFGDVIRTVATRLLPHVSTPYAAI